MKEIDIITMELWARNNAPYSFWANLKEIERRMIMPTQVDCGGKTDRQPRHHEILDAYHVLQDSIRLLKVLYNRIVETAPEPPSDRPEKAHEVAPSLAQTLVDLPKMIISESEKIRKYTDQIRDNIF